MWIMILMDYAIILDARILKFYKLARWERMMHSPTTEECIALLRKHDIFENILAHTLAVNKVAMFLARKMKERGVDVDLELVNAASLLHDIGKSEEIRRKETDRNPASHMEIGYSILKEEYSEIAAIVRKHILDDIIDTDLSQLSIEHKIIIYADKRVNHSQIVSLDERLDYIRKRYANYVSGKMEGILPKIKALESEILGLAGLSSDRLDI